MPENPSKKDRAKRMGYKDVSEIVIVREPNKKIKETDQHGHS